jgi:dTDP-4-amino-4,6-dideoxygalactose transaminase
MKVPFFEYPRLFKDNREEFLKIFEDIGNRGAFILQKDVEDFEKSISNYIGTEFAIGVANATDAMEIAWSSIGLEPGDEVIVSAHTMVATASAIVISGGTPVVVDIGQDHLIDPEAIDAAISDKTVGISPTHLNGRTCAMDKIIRIAQKHNLAIVEDAAQALGSTFDGKKAGSFGDAAAFSFYPAKILGSMGDAGAITSNNTELYEKMYELHNHGKNSKGEIKSWGRNSRLDNLQAAILNFQFISYKKTLERRREIAQIYHELLSDLEFLKLPEPPNFTTSNFDTFQNYEIEAENRDNLAQYLKLNGVETLVQWGGKGIHTLPHIANYVSLPNADRFFEKCLMLPINMFILNTQIEYVCALIKEFYSTGKLSTEGKF